MPTCTASCQPSSAIGATSALTVWVQDAKYVDDKLRDLISVAEDAIGTLDSQIRSIEGNITELESIREEDLTAVRLYRTRLYS